MSADSLVGVNLDGRFRVVRAVQRGALVATYEGIRLEDRAPLTVRAHRYPAMPAEVAALGDDARMVAELKHEALPAPYAVMRSPTGALCAVYPKLPASSLADRLQKRRPSVLGAVAIGRTVADWLQAAHVSGLLHRGLSPESLLFISDADPLPSFLVDFGVGRLGETQRTPNVTPSHPVALAVSAGHMAPEQLRGATEYVDPLADQFALAVVIYESMMGKPAFGTGTPPVILSRVLHAEPPPMAGVSRDIEKVILRALAKQKEARFPTISAFADALQEAVGQRPGEPARLPEPPRRRSRGKPREAPLPTDQVIPLPSPPSWRRWILPSLAVTSLAGAGLLVLLRSRAPQAPPPMAPVAAVTEVHVRIQVEPSTAVVRIDGQVVTPPDVVLPRSAVARRISVEAPGFLPYASELVANRDLGLTVQLVPAPPTTAVAHSHPTKAVTPAAKAAAADKEKMRLRDLRDPFETDPR